MDRPLPYPMISLQIVDLLPKEQRPHIFAEEFDYIKRIHETRPVVRESMERKVAPSVCCSLLIEPSKQAGKAASLILVHLRSLTSRPSLARPGIQVSRAVERPLLVALLRPVRLCRLQYGPTTRSPFGKPWAPFRSKADRGMMSSRRSHEGQKRYKVGGGCRKT